MSLSLRPPQAKRTDALATFPSIKGVVVEKPLGGDDGRHLIETCDARDFPVQVNYWRRGDATLQALATGDLKNRIGAFQAGHALYGNGLANNGLTPRRHDPHVVRRADLGSSAW